MKVLPQTNFEQPSDRGLLDELRDEALVVHMKPDGNRGLIIFVHGLWGSRYGQESTWGHFPEFLYEDIPEFDVALYEYRTLIRRAKFWESVSLSDEAKVLGGIIRDIEYETIVPYRP